MGNVPRQAYIPTRMADTNTLYNSDFLRWTEEQAAKLRDAKGSNLPLDWENLAEEIESLGKSEREGLRSQIRRILRHLLKLEFSNAADPRSGWGESIDDAREEIEDALRLSPSLRREVGGLISEEIATAAKLDARDLARHGEAADAIRARLDMGGYTVDQVLGDWFPDDKG
jgi:hypothetical protein